MTIIPDRFPTKILPDIDPQVRQQDQQTRFTPTTTRTTINTTNTRQSTKRLQTVAEGATIPIIYGEAIVGAKIATAVQKAGDLYQLLCVWSLGEINSIIDVTFDDVGGQARVADYLGTTTQLADASIAAEIPGYIDTLTGTQNNIDFGVAYSVIDFDSTQQPPIIRAKIQGKKVYDPRTLLTVYSDNVALVLADLMQSDLYGAGLTIDNQSIIDAADYCDTNSLTVSLVMDKSSTLERWIDAIRAYGDIFIIDNGVDYKFVIDQAHADFDPFPFPFVPPVIDGIIDAVQGTIKFNIKSMRNVPNAVKVIYTDRNNEYKEEEVTVELSGVSSGTIQRLESVYNMPGFTTEALAKRYACRRLSMANLEFVFIDFVLHDDALVYEIGDIIDLKSFLGLFESTNQRMRITNIDSRGVGRYAVKTKAYNSEIYDDCTAGGGIGS